MSDCTAPAPQAGTVGSFQASGKGASRTWTSAFAGSRQMLEVGGLILCCAALSAVHLAGVARPFFVAGSVVLAWRAWRRSPWQFITLTFWIWTTAPFARRLIDYYGGFVFNSIVLIAPNLLVGFMILDLLRTRSVWRQQGAAIGIIAIATVFYGAAVSFVTGDVVAGLVSTGEWLPPIVYYLFVLKHAATVDEGARVLRGFIVLSAGVIGIYGLLQYINPSPWDAAWALNVQMDTIGHPVPYGLKPFSMLNAPGTCALWLAMLLVLSLAYRSAWSLLVLPVASLVLVLTLVRSVTAVAFASIVGVVILGGGKIARAVLPMTAVLGIAVAGIMVMDPRVSDAVLLRFSTVGNLSQDYSAQVREDIYKATPGLIDAHPFGMGIGAFGRGARARTGEADAGVVDSGPLQIYLSLGWIAGSIYIATMLAMAMQAMAAALRCRDEGAIAFAMFVCCGLFDILFTNIVGLEGIILWFCAGMAVSLRIHAQGQRHAASLRAPSSHADILAPGIDGVPA